jgi:Flp pilus assembly protein TadG
MVRLRDERAQVLVETAIAFPVQIVITLAIMQYCLLAGAKQVVNYAAHAATRAAIVGMDPYHAASMVLSPVAGVYTPPGVAAPILIPGYGHLRGSVRSQLKTSVDLVNPPDDGDKLVTTQVTFRCELIMPFVEYTPFQDWHLLFGRIEKLGPQGVVHKVMTQTVTMPQPWDGDDKGVHGHPIIPDLGDQPEP